MKIFQLSFPLRNRFVCISQKICCSFLSSTFHSRQKLTEAEKRKFIRVSSSLQQFFFEISVVRLEKNGLCSCRNCEKRSREIL